MIRNVFQFEVTEGTDYSQSFLYNDLTTCLPIDITGYSAAMSIKQNGNGTYDGYASTVPVLELTSASGGGITLGGVAGTITVAFTAEQLTATLWNRGVYTLILTDTTGKKIPFMNGFVTILQDTVD